MIAMRGNEKGKIMENDVRFMLEKGGQEMLARLGRHPTLTEVTIWNDDRSI